MSYPIEKKLVIAVASTALFDLTEADRVYREEGLAAYQEYQYAHEDDVLKPGVAFPFVKRLLRLNAGLSAEQAPVEVVLLSRNDANTGLRVFNSIEAHNLGIYRAAFVKGGNPFAYMDAFNASLFISADAAGVRKAVEQGLPAGQVFPTDFADSDDDEELRIAFDFDGVLADDSAETVFRTQGMETYYQLESQRAMEPLSQGPLGRFFQEIANLQQFELRRNAHDPGYTPRLRTSIVTARSAPAHRRLINTLRGWGIGVDEVFFLGGIDKGRILVKLRPHIFFDDQIQHISGTADVTPCVHVPFGVANRAGAVAPLAAEAASAACSDD
ncbi:MAG: 5'-nucleotidase [Limnochordia bacterium]